MTPQEIRRRILENARDGKELYVGCGEGKSLSAAQWEMIETIAKGWIVRTDAVEDAVPAFRLTDEGCMEIARLVLAGVSASPKEAASGVPDSVIAAGLEAVAKGEKSKGVTSGEVEEGIRAVKKKRGRK